MDASLATLPTAIRFEIWSRTGRLMDSVETQVKAERLLGVWFEAKYVVSVMDNGERVVVCDRKELR